MNILMISYHTCPLASEEGKVTGGMNIYVNELAKELSSMGHRIDVITRCQDETSERIVNVSENYRVIHLPAGPINYVDKRKLIEYVPEFINSFHDFHKTDLSNYDLIHAHYYQSGKIGLILKDMLQPKTPLVSTFHTLGLMKNLVARNQSEQESDVRIKTEFEIAKNSCSIISPSITEKKYLQYLYEADPQKISVIAPGVNFEIFRPIEKITSKKILNLDYNEKIILFVGRIEPLKGIDTLMYAAKILKHEAPDTRFKFLILGGDISQHLSKWSPVHRQLAHLRHLLDLGHEVMFIGQKQQHELAIYYNASDIVVMPSHYESFGMTAAEAMASGVPVITTNVAGISTLIEEKWSSLITSANNPLLLSSQIKKLLTDRELYDKVRSDMLDYVRNLTWKEMALKTQNIYERCLS